MASDRGKEREAELEAAMYTNCLLLGLDPVVLGVGPAGGSPRVGLFRHSNPRLGEQLLHFLLSALRGPAQASKDFDKVWPIFDSSQSRDFRKIVQGIINELESQGALPKSNSRVSSLATCCGLRFVELLWQISVHALREVHKRMFGASVASNPLPAPLTDLSYLHAASLLPVTKARIALERRKFLKTAATAVQRQATWSNLAQEMTNEFRSLCAEEAFLQQELEKLQYLRNKANLDSESRDDSFGSLSQNSQLVQKATRLWESMLGRMGQHEVLASGPIEDLIAHREHRYRISGSSLLAAMDPSSDVCSSDAILGQSDDNYNSSGGSQGHCDPANRITDGRRVEPSVDIAEILRCWTHALQRIHKQSVQLVKANEGSGPELLQCSDTTGNAHTESLTATLAEHRQHLVSMQVLINQLKEAVPNMQKSIAELTDEVSNASHLFPLPEYSTKSTSHTQSQRNGQNKEEVAELASKLSGIKLERSAVTPSLRLPQLFGSTPNSSGRSVNPSKEYYEERNAKQSFPDRPADDEGDDISYINNLKHSVREAALSSHQSIHFIDQEEKTADFDVEEADNSRHFFLPLSVTGDSHRLADGSSNRPEMNSLVSPIHSDAKGWNEVPNLDSYSIELDSRGFEFRKCLQTCDANCKTPFSHLSPLGSLNHALSPPLLMDSSFLSDAYEDLLAPLSETEAALMEQ